MSRAVAAGTTLAGLDVNYNTSKKHYTSSNSGVSDPDKTYSFSVMPTFGVFVSSHWLVGVKANVTKAKEGNSYQPTFTVKDMRSKSYSFGPFVRYYKMLGDKTSIFIQGEVTWGKDKLSYNITELQNNYVFDLEDKINTFQSGVRPGIVYFITKKLVLESTIGFIGYTRMTTNNNLDGFGLDNVQKDFLFSFSPSTINIGFKCYL
jgi:hypothetical protein